MKVPLLNHDNASLAEWNFLLGHALRAFKYCVRHGMLEALSVMAITAVVGSIVGLAVAQIDERVPAYLSGRALISRRKFRMRMIVLWLMGVPVVGIIGLKLFGII
jgi:hypothetical protein